MKVPTPPHEHTCYYRYLAAQLDNALVVLRNLCTTVWASPSPCYNSFRGNLAMLTAAVETSWLEHVLSSFPQLRAAVLGDFCLDAYWILDTESTEFSVETSSRSTKSSQDIRTRCLWSMHGIILISIGEPS